MLIAIDNEEVGVYAVRRTQPITKGQNFVNNPYSIAPMVRW